MNPWDQIRQYVQQSMAPDAHLARLEGTAFVGMDNDTLVVAVPDRQARAFLETEYGPLIRAAIRELGLPVRDVSFEWQLVSKPPSAAPAGPGGQPNPKSALNPRYTFSSFVVGACNQFAHAAARAVATNPSHSYNPLFLYGGVGIGKTHLMQAIGRELMDSFGSLRVTYVSTERFMNEMIMYLQRGQIGEFQQRYRETDVLLMDDIQVLGNKERTQEEFFHTFNELYDRQKQIVIASDSQPRSIPGLEERLRSRFEWGLLADLQTPDLETKMAILDKKAQSEGITLPDDVRSFLASRIKSNVRELEGALTRLIAYSSVTGTEISLAMAQQVLKPLVQSQNCKVSIDGIQRAVAESFQITQATLKQRDNSAKVAYPRQVAMYLVRELTDASLPEIGRAFGGKHHTTVQHSIHKISEQRKVDAKLDELLRNLADSLQ